MGNQKKVNVKLTANESLRKGVYSNAAFAKTTDKESVLDFVLLDSEEEDDDQITAEGILVSRIIMTNESLVRLSDMLVEHIKTNLKRTDA